MVERHLLAPSLERVALRVGECLEPPGQPIGYVYFPVEGLISMFAGATPGTRIEIATVPYRRGPAPAHGHRLLQRPGDDRRAAGPLAGAGRRALGRAPPRDHLITHDALAEVLGVRRPSVTTGLQVLEGRHLIRSTRRAIVVLDPQGLAEVARR